MGGSKMSKFVLLVALLATSGDLEPYLTLTPPMSLRECERLRENPTISISYLEDAWYGQKIPGQPVLVCVEYTRSSYAAQ
jgi:hypothetical protein